MAPRTCRSLSMTTCCRPFGDVAPPSRPPRIGAGRPPSATACPGSPPPASLGPVPRWVGPGSSAPTRPSRAAPPPRGPRSSQSPVGSKERLSLSLHVPLAPAPQAVRAPCSVVTLIRPPSSQVRSPPTTPGLPMLPPRACLLPPSCLPPSFCSLFPFLVFLFQFFFL